MSGRSRMRYAHLFVQDARDEQVAARFEVSGRRLKIIVDDQEAVYPIEVDPLVTVSEAKLLADVADKYDSFGESVAVDGDTMVVGAHADDERADNAGSAFVYRLLELSLGADCTATPSWCASGYCVDGVCCAVACNNGATDDCQACSVAAGAPTDGACALLGPSYECRPVADGVGTCDVAEVCDGSHVDCPNDVVISSGLPCGDQGVECYVNDACDGNGLCQDNGLVDDGSACTDDELFCTGEEVCQSGSCVSPGAPCPSWSICDDDLNECQVGGTLVVNEIDYEQDCTDAAEFIEIMNISGGSVNLDGLDVLLVNGEGEGASVYGTIPLPEVDLPDGAHFVICGDSTNVENCDLDESEDTDLVQNGSPDAVALVYGTFIVDTVSYDGDTGAPYTETSGVGLEDTDDIETSISRFPDGTDTDVNNVDLTLRCATPGLANTARDSDCLCGNGDVEGEEDCDTGLDNGSTICGCQIGCQWASSTISCSDSLVCNGEEVCDGEGVCQAGEDAENGTVCADDGLFCSGVEQCLSGVCINSGNPCIAPEVCSEDLNICLAF